MTLALKDALSTSAQSLAKFVDALGSTLWSPELVFVPSTEATDGRTHVPAEALAFALLTAAFGTVIGTFLAGVPLTKAGLAADGASVLVILSCWLGFAFGVHPILVRFGAVASMSATVAIFLQVLGTAYFVAHLLLLVTGRVLFHVGSEEIAVLGGVTIFLVAQFLVIARALQPLLRQHHALSSRASKVAAWSSALLFVMLNVAIFVAAYVVGYFAGAGIDFSPT